MTYIDNGSCVVNQFFYMLNAFITWQRAWVSLNVLDDDSCFCENISEFIDR